MLCRMGRRAGFCVNSILAQREEKMAAKAGGEPEFEIWVFLILGFAAAMEDGEEGALRQGGPGGIEKIFRFSIQSKVFRWSGSIEAEESGSGGEAQAGTSIVGG